MESSTYMQMFKTLLDEVSALAKTVGTLTEVVRKQGDEIRVLKANQTLSRVSNQPTD